MHPQSCHGYRVVIGHVYRTGNKFLRLINLPKLSLLSGKAPENWQSYQAWNYSVD